MPLSSPHQGVPRCDTASTGTQSRAGTGKIFLAARVLKRFQRDLKRL